MRPHCFWYPSQTCCSGPYPSCDTTMDFVQTGVCINSTVCVVHLQAGGFTQSSTACVDDVSNTCRVWITIKGNLMDVIIDICLVGITKTGNLMDDIINLF